MKKLLLILLPLCALLLFLVAASNNNFDNLVASSIAATSGTIYSGFNVGGTALFTNGLATLSSNLQISASISVGSSAFSFTNTTALSGGKNINVFISGGTTGAVTKNGQSIYAAIAAGPALVPLKPNEYLTLTYTGSPTMRWEPQ